MASLRIHLENTGIYFYTYCSCQSNLLFFVFIIDLVYHDPSWGANINSYYVSSNIFLSSEDPFHLFNLNATLLEEIKVKRPKLSSASITSYWLVVVTRVVDEQMLVKESSYLGICCIRPKSQCLSCESGQWLVSRKASSFLLSQLPDSRVAFPC